MNDFLGFLNDSLWPAFVETIEMMVLAGILSTIFGVLLGILLNVLSPNGISKNKIAYNIISTIINMIRSIPFLILGVLAIPFTMWVTGIFGRATFFGALASCVPLTIASTAFIAKVVESSTAEVSPQLIEAGLSLGLSKTQIVTKILLKEALPSIINGISLAMVSLLGISAVVVAWSGGGLGSLAKLVGVDDGDTASMLIIVLVIIIIVLVIQVVGNILYKLVKESKKFKLSYVTIPFTVLSLVVLIACNVSFDAKARIVVGGMANPSAPVINNIKEDFEKEGYDLELEIFSEFALGNPALASGTVDATLFQHTPYLNSYLSSNPSVDFTVAATIYYPLFGGYSKTITNVSQIKSGDTIAIPNDVSNGVRALKLLDNANIISITIPDDLTGVSMTDLTKIGNYTNNKNIKIELADAANCALAAKNGTAALGICSYTYASAQGFDVRNDTIVSESTEMQTTYANILVVRTEDKDKEWVSTLTSLLTSKKSQEFIDEYFEGAMLPLCNDYINNSRIKNCVDLYIDVYKKNWI